MSRYIPVSLSASLLPPHLVLHRRSNGEATPTAHPTRPRRSTEPRWLSSHVLSEAESRNCNRPPRQPVTAHLELWGFQFIHLVRALPVSWLPPLHPPPSTSAAEETVKRRGPRDSVIPFLLIIDILVVDWIVSLFAGDESECVLRGFTCGIHHAGIVIYVLEKTLWHSWAAKNKIKRLKSAVWRHR